MNTISVEELEKIDASEITIVDVRPADQYPSMRTMPDRQDSKQIILETLL